MTTYPIEKIRIIPADAGSTILDDRPRRYTTDHPRGCGEHVDPGISRCNQTGSSPRMRGALARNRSGNGGAGIIPADAGSTLNLSCRKIRI